jgi:aldose 1-epimerase
MNDIERSGFGQVDGQAVDLYTLTNRQGRILKLTSYGAAVTELHVPDREGRLADVVLGFDNLQAYVDHRAYFGATVGRVANRIRGAAFMLEGRRYEVAATDGIHHLHGGRRGWDRAVWGATPLSTDRGPSVEFTYVSPDGDEGYPGQVVASTRYTLTHEDELLIEMQAESDQTTLVNMAHHTYWNLGGHASGDILDHELSLESEIYTPGDPVVPVGHLEAIAGTPFDFRKKKPIGRDLELVGGSPVGFDHNWAVLGVPGQLRPVARLAHPGSGRVLTLDADAPGVQFYSGNFLDGSITGKGGQRYAQRAGLCLETQAFPNAINVPDWAEQVVLKDGQEYRHTMLHRFTAS